MSQSGSYDKSNGGGGGGGVLTLEADNHIAVAPNNLGRIFVKGSGGILTQGNNGTHTLLITGTPSGLSWENVISNVTMVPNTNYMVTANSVNLSMPNVANFGDQIEIVLDGGASFTITLSPPQSIVFGDTIASTFISSNSNGDAIRLVAKESGILWVVVSTMGNLNYS